MTDLERLGLAMIGFAVAIIVCVCCSGSLVPPSGAGVAQAGVKRTLQYEAD